MKKGSFVNFSELAQILADDDAENDLSSTLIIGIKGHLKSLSDSLDECFSNLLVKPWIVDPFTIPIDRIDNGNKLKDDLIEFEGLQSPEVAVLDRCHSLGVLGKQL